MNFEVTEHVGDTYRVRLTRLRIVDGESWFVVPTGSVFPFLGTLDRIILDPKSDVNYAYLMCAGNPVMDLELSTGQFPCRVPVGIIHYAQVYIVVRGARIDHVDFVGKEFPEEGTIMDMGTFMPAPVVMPSHLDPQMIIELHEFIASNGSRRRHTFIVMHGLMVRKYDRIIDLPFKG